MLLLIEALKDRYWGTRAWAATELGRLGVQAEKAVPALRRATADRRRRVRKAAKDAEEFIRSCGAYINTAIIDDDPLSAESERDKIFKEKLAERAAMHQAREIARTPL